MIEDDHQTGDAQNEEEDDQNIPKFDDETRNVDREDRVIQTGQRRQGLVEDRREMIEKAETSRERLTDLLVDNDERNDHRDIHQEIEENTKTLKRQVAADLFPLSTTFIYHKQAEQLNVGNARDHVGEERGSGGETGDEDTRRGMPKDSAHHLDHLFVVDFHHSDQIGVLDSIEIFLFTSGCLCSRFVFAAGQSFPQHRRGVIAIASILLFLLFGQFPVEFHGTIVKTRLIVDVELLRIPGIEDHEDVVTRNADQNERGHQIDVREQIDAEGDLVGEIRTGKGKNHADIRHQGHSDRTKIDDRHLHRDEE